MWKTANETSIRKTEAPSREAKRIIYYGFSLLVFYEQKNESIFREWDFNFASK